MNPPISEFFKRHFVDILPSSRVSIVEYQEQDKIYEVALLKSATAKEKSASSCSVSGLVVLKERSMKSRKL